MSLVRQLSVKWHYSHTSQSWILVATWVNGLIPYEIYLPTEDSCRVVARAIQLAHTDGREVGEQKCL